MKVRHLRDKFKFCEQKKIGYFAYGHFGMLKFGILILLFFNLGLMPNLFSHGVMDVSEEIQLSEALTKLSQKYEVFFSYDDKMVRDVEVTYEPDQYRSIKHALNELLAGTTLRFKIFDNRYIILYEQSDQAISSLKGMVRHLESVIDSQEEISRSRKVERPVSQLSSLATRRIQRLTFNVSGTVRDENGEALIGVNIQVKGTNKGASTDFEGHFTLDDIDENAVLVVSYIGYQTQEVSVAGKSNLLITLASDSQLLDEVVVVGYGTQRKSDITGAVASLKMDEDLQSRTMVEFGQAMYGRLPGVQIINSNGRPGSSSSIQIRGINSISANSSPLIVVDGIPLPNYDLNLINPSDIKSIEILKDAASASIFGSRGANGVVLVTTKSGQSGKAKLSINYSYNLQETIGKIDVMDSYQYAAAAIDAAQNGWVETGGDPNAPNTIEARGQYKYTWPKELESPESLPNTDWQDLIFRTAPMHKIDMNLSGGNENMTYRLSGGYVDQTGIVITSDYEKYSLNFKMSTRINDWAEFGGMLNTVYDHENEPFNRIVEWAVQYPSIYPVYGRNGYLGEPNSVDGFGEYDAILFRAFNGHPLYRINDDIQHKRFNGLGNVFGSIDILPNLNFKSTLNLYYRRIDNTNYATRDHNMGPNVQTEGIMTVGQVRRSNYNLQNILRYDKQIGSHDFTVMIGQEYFQDDFFSLTSQRRGYNDDLIPYLSPGENVSQANDDATKRTLISYFTRINYSFKNKYIFATSLRRDGSSRFGPNNKWGYFPSASVAWYISDENFMNSVQSISDLKLRASYGFTGNDQFADYRWISTLNQAKIAFGDYLTISNFPSGFTNPNLAWEKSQQLNIGIDLGLFKNRMIFEGNVYTTKSDGLLLNVPVPTVTGFSNIFKNIGKLQNNGIELSLSTRNLTGDFKWNTQLNFSKNKNKILALGPSNAPQITNAGFGMQAINKVGEPIYSFYGYEYDGVYKNQEEIENDPASYATAVPGDGKYKDVNNDGILDAADRTIIGNAAPDFSWGMTNSFQYNEFDFSFVFMGVHGNDVFDNNIHRSKLYHEGRNYYQSVTERWRSAEDPGNGYQYKLTTNIDGYEKQPSSFWIEDGSFIRLKSLTMGYNLPADISNRIGLGSVRAYLSAQNLLTLKDIPVFDPENYNGGATNTSRRGVAHSPYPSAKIYSLGINVNF